MVIYRHHKERSRAADLRPLFVLMTARPEFRPAWGALFAQFTMPMLKDGEVVGSASRPGRGPGLKAAKSLISLARPGLSGS
jgi:hypothetical protein